MSGPTSAGILLFRKRGATTEVLLIRPGGPFWRNRDVGSWMIPKGQVEAGETPVEAALREFHEELGSPLDAIPFPLCRVRQSGGKLVDAFAVEGDLDCDGIVSAQFELEWPRNSGRKQMVPEVEEGRWFALEEAKRMMLPSQLPILTALEQKLAN